jgi:hypothetical protein
MSMKCECIAFGDCDSESRYSIRIPDYAAGDYEEASVCSDCYARLQDRYEGHIEILAVRKQWPNRRASL